MTITNYAGEVIGSSGLGQTAYEYDWYSGSQIQIMIGDVLIDNAVQTNFVVTQNKTPIWGYSNQYYAFAADGRVFVQGQITIAFKEAGYLLSPIVRFQKFNQAGEWQSPRYSITDGKFSRQPDNLSPASSFTSLAEEARRKQTMKANVEQMFAWSNQSSNAANQQQKNYARARNNNFVKQLGRLKDDEFEDWAETFEDALWYSTDIQNRFLREKVNSKNLKSTDFMDTETILQHRRPDQYPPVDVWIVYGDTSNHATNHTVKKLIDVEFTGSSQEIRVSGEPIYEVYPFIAKNFV